MDKSKVARFLAHPVYSHFHSHSFLQDFSLPCTNRVVTEPTADVLAYNQHFYVNLYVDKCTKRQFIHLLTATLKNSHIENSKNHKR